MALVEFFCGIGGVAEAVRQLDLKSQRTDLQTTHAIDIDRACGEVYRHNFGRKVDCRTIESIDLDSIAASPSNDNFWWLSPPCQPYCRRGRGQCDSDDRCRALLAIIAWFRSRPVRLPDQLVLENVPEFENSSHADRLRDALSCNGFNIAESILCPTQFGIPNRRRRYYLMAARECEVSEVTPTQIERAFNIADVLEPIPDPISSLWLDPGLASDYSAALDVVDIDDPGAVTACFTSGYGKSIVRSGSYLKQDGRLRRFSPSEIARLLGFSDSFAFPDNCTNRQRWKMLGNSLSIDVVKAVLRNVLK